MTQLAVGHGLRFLRRNVFTSIGMVAQGLIIRLRSWLCGVDYTLLLISKYRLRAFMGTQNWWLDGYLVRLTWILRYFKVGWTEPERSGIGWIALLFFIYIERTTPELIDCPRGVCWRFLVFWRLHISKTASRLIFRTFHFLNRHHMSPFIILHVDGFRLGWICRVYYCIFNISFVLASILFVHTWSRIDLRQASVFLRQASVVYLFRRACMYLQMCQSDLMAQACYSIRIQNIFIRRAWSTFQPAFSLFPFSWSYLCFNPFPLLAPFVLLHIHLSSDQAKTSERAHNMTSERVLQASVFFLQMTAFFSSLLDPASIFLLLFLLLYHNHLFFYS